MIRGAAILVVLTDLIHNTRIRVEEIFKMLVDMFVLRFMILFYGEKRAIRYEIKKKCYMDLEYNVKTFIFAA